MVSVLGAYDRAALSARLGHPVNDVFTAASQQDGGETDSASSRDQGGTIAAIVLGVVVGVLLIVLVIVLLVRASNKNKGQFQVVDGSERGSKADLGAPIHAYERGLPSLEESQVALRGYHRHSEESDGPFARASEDTPSSAHGHQMKLAPGASSLRGPKPASDSVRLHGGGAVHVTRVRSSASLGRGEADADATLLDLSAGDITRAWESPKVEVPLRQTSAQRVYVEDGEATRTLLASSDASTLSGILEVDDAEGEEVAMPVRRVDRRDSMLA
jgi:hypothetical protein